MKAVIEINVVKEVQVNPNGRSLTKWERLRSDNEERVENRFDTIIFITGEKTCTRKRKSSALRPGATVLVFKDNGVLKRIEAVSSEITKEEIAELNLGIEIIDKRIQQ